MLARRHFSSRCASLLRSRGRRFGAPNGPEFAEEVEQFLGGDVVAKVFHEECAERHQ